MKIEIGEIIMAVGLALMVVLAGCLIYCMLAGDNDDRPDWADDMADKLSDKGGKISVYRAWGDSNYGYNYTITITAGQKVYADSYGLVVKSDNGVTIYQYERIANIYINS